MGRREGHAVVGPNRLGQPKLLEGPLKDREREFLGRRGERFAGQEVPAGEIGDRQRIAVAAIPEHELALVVGTPEGVRLGGSRQHGAGRVVSAPLPPFHEAVAIEHGMDRTDGRQLWRRRLPPQLLANLRCAPGRVLPLQPDNRRFQLRRQSVRLTIWASTAIAERRDAAILVALEDLVACLPRDPELRAQRRHLLALEQAGDKPESLVHDVTLLPRHAPSWWGQSVTHPLGIRCYLTLRKDTLSLGLVSIGLTPSRRALLRAPRARASPAED